MRTSSKTNNYTCKIYDHAGLCIHNKDYITLPQMADDLQLSKDVVYNLSSRNGNYNTQYKKFKYQPKIEISRINKDAETD